jgi:hypothetical protein
MMKIACIGRMAPGPEHASGERDEVCEQPSNDMAMRSTHRGRPVLNPAAYASKMKAPWTELCPDRSLFTPRAGPLNL